MIKINLLDKKANVSGPLAKVLEALNLTDVTPEEWATYRGFALKVLVFIIGIYVADFVPAKIREQKIAELDQTLQQLQSENQSLTQELRAKQAIRSEMEKINAAEAEIRGRLNVISSLDADRYRAFKVMDTLSLLIPDRVWISRLAFTSKTLDVNGASWEFLPINDFVTLLKQSGVFDNVRLKQINTVQSPRGIVPGVALSLQTQKQYEINMDIRGLQVGSASDPASAPAGGATGGAPVPGEAPAPAAVN